MQRSEPLRSETPAGNTPPSKENSPASPDPAEAFEALQRAFWHFVEHVLTRADFARYSLRKALLTFLAGLAEFFIFIACLVFAVCLALYGLGAGIGKLFPTATGLGFVIVGLSFTAASLVFFKVRKMRVRKKALKERLHHERQRIDRWKSRWQRGGPAVSRH